MLSTCFDGICSFLTCSLGKHFNVTLLEGSEGENNLRNQQIILQKGISYESTDHRLSCGSNPPRSSLPTKESQLQSQVKLAKSKISLFFVRLGYYFYTYKGNRP